MAITPAPKNTPRKQQGRGPGKPLAVEKEITEVGDTLQSALWKWPGDKGNVIWYPTDEILSRKGFSEYRLMRHDDQVKACLAFKKILITARSYDIIPAIKDDPKAEAIAKFVQQMLSRMNLNKILREALTALDFGFSIGELIFEPVQYEGNTSIMVTDVRFRDPECWQVMTDQFGTLTGYEQRVIGKQIQIEPRKVFHYAHNAEFSNPYGNSDLRAAYRAWWAKKFIVNFWSVFLERMGTPTMAMKYPQGSTAELKATLKRILTGLSTRAEVLIPQGVEIDIVESMRSGNPTYDKALAYHDNAIARAILMVALLGAGGDEITRGADSQSRLHLRTLFKMTQQIGEELIYQFDRQVIRQVVDMNFEHENLYPKFVWQDYGEFEGIEVADTIRLLHAAGIVDMDQTDVNYARSVLGLPVRGEDDEQDEVVRPQPLPPPASPNAPPPPAGQGNELAKKGAGGKRVTDMNNVRKK